MGNQVTYEQQNRRGLLWVHACIGVIAGAQMLVYGSATTIEATLGIWSRGLMGALGIVGGLFLAIGLSRRPRSIPFEVAGLVLVGVWDLLMTAGLALARWRQHDWRPIPLREALPQGYASAYPVTVYAGLLALIVIHLLTLRRLTRSGVWSSEHG
ncbi:MAG: hypothetical protein JWM31_3085, partial [Solirubrobacterales bacterium]|nr:hypothetical protein [Solirubrobacterales bacterium]